jgi:transcriptional regulator with XRE-family HTH domain
MDDPEIANYLRSLRKSAGLSQRDLAKLVGYLTVGQISKYERGEIVPSLLVAFAYESIFRAPVADMFPGIFGTVSEGIEDRLAKMESELHRGTAKGRHAHVTARKLEWLWERKNPEVNAQN